MMMKFPFAVHLYHTHNSQGGITESLPALFTHDSLIHFTLVFSRVAMKSDTDKLYFRLDQVLIRQKPCFGFVACTDLALHFVSRPASAFRGKPSL